MNKLKYLYRALRYRYLLDAPEIRFLLRSLQRGNIAVDIGSHKGGYLYWMRRAVGKNGKVFGFEPQPRLYEYLQGVKQKMSYENVLLENKGLSAEAGHAELHIPVTPSGASPGARLDGPTEQDRHEKLQIELVTLDGYFLRRDIFPDLIKIDVEGHEQQVLRGGRETLRCCKPKLIIECENRHLASGDVLDVFGELDGLGYQGYFYAGRQWRPLSRFDPAVHQKAGEGRFWEEKGYVNNFVFE